MGTLELRDSVLRSINTADERLLKVVKAVIESYQENDIKEELLEAKSEIERGEYTTQDDLEKGSDSLMDELKKVWTNTAKVQLKAIYENYKVKSLQGAKSIKDEILQATKELQLAEQNQQDENEPDQKNHRKTL